MNEIGESRYYDKRELTAMLQVSELRIQALELACGRSRSSHPTTRPRSNSSRSRACGRHLRFHRVLLSPPPERRA